MCTRGSGMRGATRRPGGGHGRSTRISDPFATDVDDTRTDAGRSSHVRLARTAVRSSHGRYGIPRMLARDRVAADRVVLCPPVIPL
jgi:hypothetical protein